MHSFASSGIVINGVAGSGKTTIISKIAKIVQSLHLNLKICTPTNCSKEVYMDIDPNIPVSTYHSFFNLIYHEKKTANIFNDIKRSPLEYLHISNIMAKQYELMKPELKEKLSMIDIIIIDEISMISNSTLVTLDLMLRVATNRTVEFGGKLVILIGDLYQLEPVVNYPKLG